VPWTGAAFSAPGLPRAPAKPDSGPAPSRACRHEVVSRAASKVPHATSATRPRAAVRRSLVSGGANLGSYRFSEPALLTVMPRELTDCGSTTTHWKYTFSPK
jgi:hypothetical protein